MSKVQPENSVVSSRIRLPCSQGGAKAHKVTWVCGQSAQSVLYCAVLLGEGCWCNSPTTSRWTGRQA